MSTRYAYGKGSFNDTIKYLFNNSEKDIEINIDYEINYDATESDGWGPNDPVQEYVTGIDNLSINHDGSILDSGDEVFIIVEKILKDNSINININDISNIEFPLIVIYENDNDEVNYKVEEIEPKGGSFDIGNNKIEINFNDNNDILIKINDSDIIHIKYNELKRVLESIIEKLENIERSADFN